MSNSNITFRPSMSGSDFNDAIRSLKSGLNSYANDVSLDNGEFVVYLRKPTFSEKVKMALMPPKMKQERVAVLHAVVREAAERMGLNGAEFLRSIATEKTTSKDHAVHGRIFDSGVLVALHNAERFDIFS